MQEFRDTFFQQHFDRGQKKFLTALRPPGFLVIIITAKKELLKISVFSPKIIKDLLRHHPI